MAFTTPSASLSTFTPALKPPLGVVSNPEHPASLAHLATVTIAICIPTITIFFVLRCYERFYIKRLFTFEDVMCIMLWAGTVAYCTIMRITMSRGGGMHMWDISAQKSHEESYWFNVCAIEYGFMIGLAKVAVLCLYRRVFFPRRWSAFHIIIIGLIGIIVTFYVVTSFFKIFECWPRNKIWDKTLPGKCVQMKSILNASGGFNTITDWIILMLPIHAIIELQMKKKKKILVFLAFTFGACAPIFATVGFVVRIQNSGNKDVSWKQPEILLWGAGELTSSILILCFPELAALIRRASRTKRPAPHISGLATLKGWITPSSVKKTPPDPYMTDSLMTTTFNGNDGQYIELQDVRNDVRIECQGNAGKRPDAPDNKVLVRSEVTIESHQAVQEASYVHHKY